MSLSFTKEHAFDVSKKLALNNNNKKLYESLILQYTNPRQEWGKNNLRDLIFLYSGSGYSNEKIYNILYSLGIEKDTAYNAIEKYLPKNNNTKMKIDENLDFTKSIYSLIDKMQSLKENDPDNYNIDNVISACESYLNTNKDNMSLSDITNSANRLISNLNQFDFIPSVKECITLIEDTLHERAMSIEIDSLHKNLNNKNVNKMYSSVIDRINALKSMNESELRKKMNNELDIYKTWVPGVKVVLEKLNAIEGNTKVKETLSSKFNLKQRINNLNESISKINSENSKFVSNSIKSICSAHLNKLYGNKNSVSESSIVYSFINELQPYNWLKPVNETIDSILKFMNENYMSFEVDSVLRKLEHNNKSNVYSTAIDTLNNIKDLNESEIRDSIKYRMDNLTWVPEVKYLIESLNNIENNLSETSDATITRKYSPILEKNDGVYFYLTGNTYVIKENEIKAVDPKTLDTLFLTLIAVSENFKFGTGRMTYYKNNNTIELSLTDGNKCNFKFNGNKVNINESNDIRNFLLSNGSFKISDTSELNMIVKAYENINSFVELDFVNSINSRQYKGLTVNTIRLGESVYINRINTSMGVNEMIKADSAKEAIDLVKEYINYDIKAKVKDLLEGELRKEAIIEEKRNQIFDKIQFLKEQRSRISETGIINENLKAADNLLISEINKFEKQLNSLL